MNKIGTLNICDPLQHILIAKDRWRPPKGGLLSVPNADVQFRLTAKVLAIGSAALRQPEGEWLKDLKVGDTIIYDRSGGWKLDQRHSLITPARVLCIVYKD